MYSSPTEPVNATSTEQTPGARFLVVAAAGVVVVWGLRYLAPILLPFALALFLSVLALPVLGALRSRGVPSWAAITLAMAAVVGIFAVFVLLVSGSLADLQGRINFYTDRWSTVEAELIVALQRLLEGFMAIEPGAVEEQWQSLALAPDPGRLFEIAGSTLSRAASILGQGFIVFLIMVFILGEAIIFPKKLEAIFGDSVTGEERMRKVISEVQQYLGIKTLVSLATGVVIGTWCWAMNLDFPVLLGLIAFALNYIPTVGSIIAGVPAVGLALILTGSLVQTLVVAAGYVIVNTVFGNFIEPSLMGRRLGLSTLVVILSLLFWGWTWGPLGALLSVPLTMIVKIWLENTEDLRWVALLLDKQARDGGAPAPPRRATAAADAADEATRRRVGA